MPVLSPRGLWALKAGTYQWNDTILDLTQQVGPYVNICGWFRENELCYAQQVDGVNSIYTRNNDTGKVRKWDAPGPNQLVAGGGVWASFSDQGYSDSWGPNPYFPDQRHWFPQCVDETTGQIALTLDGAGRDLCVYQGHEDPKQATLTPLLKGLGFGSWFSQSILTIWWEGQWFHWYRGALNVTPTGSLTRAQMFPTAQWMNGWNLGHSPSWAQVIWMDWNPTKAISIYQRDNFGAKIYRSNNADPIITIVGSKGEGEVAGDQQVFTVDLTKQTVNGVPWELVDATKIDVIPPYRPPVFSPTTRRMAVLCTGEDIVDPSSPQFAWTPMPKVCFGVLSTIDKDDPAKIKGGYEIADRLGVFVYAYVDTPFVYEWWKLPPYASAANTIPTVQCYLQIGESLDAAEARCLANFAILRGRGWSTVAAMGQAYRGSKGNGTYWFSEQQLADWWERLHLMAERIGIRAIVLFEYDRADGLGFPPCARLRESLPSWRQAVPDWEDWPIREDDDMKFTLPAKQLVPYWELPGQYSYPGDQGMKPNKWGIWFGLNDRGEILWREGYNEGGHGDQTILSNFGFEWDGLSPIAYAQRNGLRFELKIDLDR